MNTFIAVPLLSFALLGIASTAYAGFEVEPNQDSMSATFMPMNEVFTGGLQKSGGNIDYYRFTVTNPGEVDIHFRNLMEHERSVSVYLYDINLRTLDSKTINAYDVANNSFKKILTAGTFFIKISTSSKKSDTNYELSVLNKPSVTPSIVGSVGMPDLNANGNKDIAILRILADTSGVVETRDGSTGEILNSIPLEGESLKPISIIGFDDKNVGVLVYDSIAKTHTQYIFDAVTGDLVTSFPIE